MTKKEIIDAWAEIRRTNHSIPDDVLDFMKDSAIKALDREGKWKSVDGIEEVPEGKWLVRIERKSMFGTEHTANVSSNISTIGGQFAFDVPKVIAYKSID